MAENRDVTTIVFKDSSGKDPFDEGFGLLHQSLEKLNKQVDEQIEQERRANESLLRQSMQYHRSDDRSSMRDLTSAMGRTVQRVHVENLFHDLVHPLYERMQLISEAASIRSERYDREHFFYYYRIITAIKESSEKNQETGKGIILLWRYMKNHPVLGTGKLAMMTFKGIFSLAGFFKQALFGWGDQRNTQEKILDVLKRTLHFQRTGEAKGRYRSVFKTLKEEGVIGAISGVVARSVAQEREKRRAAGEKVGSGFLGMGARADWYQAENITQYGRAGGLTRGQTEGEVQKVSFDGIPTVRVEQIEDQQFHKPFAIIPIIIKEKLEEWQEEQGKTFLTATGEAFDNRDEALMDGFATIADTDHNRRLSSQIIKEMKTGNSIANTQREEFANARREQQKNEEEQKSLAERTLEVSEDTAKNTKKGYQQTRKHRLQSMFIAIKQGLLTFLSSPVALASLIGAGIYFWWKKRKEDAGKLGEIWDESSLTEKVVAIGTTFFASKALLSLAMSKTPWGAATVAGGGTGWLLGSAMQKELDERISNLLKREETLGGLIYDIVHGEVSAWELLTLSFDNRVQKLTGREETFGELFKKIVNKELGVWELLQTSIQNRFDNYVNRQAERGEFFLGLFRRKSQKVEESTRSIEDIKNELERTSLELSVVDNEWNRRFFDFRSQSKEKYMSDLRENAEKGQSILNSSIAFFRRENRVTVELQSTLDREIEETNEKVEGMFSSITGFFGGIRDRIRGLGRSSKESDSDIQESTSSAADQLTSFLSREIGKRETSQSMVGLQALRPENRFGYVGAVSPVESSPSVVFRPPEQQEQMIVHDPNSEQMVNLLKNIDRTLKALESNKPAFVPFGNEPDTMLNINLLGQ
jgi:hypothetical protein